MKPPATNTASRPLPALHDRPLYGNRISGANSCMGQLTPRDLAACNSSTPGQFVVWQIFAIEVNREYTSERLQQLLEGQGITHSMSRAGARRV